MQNIQSILDAIRRAVEAWLRTRPKPNPKPPEPPDPKPPPDLPYRGGVVKDRDGTVLRDAHGRALKADPDGEKQQP